VPLNPGLTRDLVRGLNPSIIRAAGEAADASFADVVLLMNFEDGTNLGVDAVDLSAAAHGGGTWQQGAKVSTDQAKFGVNSLKLDGNTDRITFANDADFQFGAGDFTVEAWVWGTQDMSTFGHGTLASLWTAGQQSWMFQIQSGGNGNILTRGSVDGTTLSINVTNSLVAEVAAASWYHVAWSRVGNTLYACVNDNIEALVDVTGITFHPSTGVMDIGAHSNTSDEWSGFIDSIRITKGVGRYSGSVDTSYGEPTEAFPTA